MSFGKASTAVNTVSATSFWAPPVRDSGVDGLKPVPLQSITTLTQQKTPYQPYRNSGNPFRLMESYTATIAPDPVDEELLLNVEEGVGGLVGLSFRDLRLTSGGRYPCTVCSLLYNALHHAVDEVCTPHILGRLLLNRSILDGVDGWLPRGQLLGVLGPSGETKGHPDTNPSQP